MLTFKSYLAEEKKKKEAKHYHKVFMGKKDIDDDDEDYTKVFMGKKKIDEAFLNDTAKIQGRRPSEISALHKSLSNRYKFGKKVPKWEEPKLDDPHGDLKVAIRSYTGAAYRKINKAHYAGTQDHLPAEHLYTSDKLKEGLRMYKTGADMTVHTGLKTDPRDIAPHEGKIKMEMPAFTSTTLRSSQARDFARDLVAKDSRKNSESHVMHIDVPKGSHGAYIAHHSKVPEEKEFLLHPGSRVHVDPEPINTEEHTSWTGAKHRTFHWRGRLVHDGVKDV